MIEFGYFLSCEEHEPKGLVRQAQMAQDAGMQRVWISDHYHPWLDEQGQSPFVWSVIGAIAATTSLHVATAVTCPTMRIHPAIVAQAAATSAMLLDGRFELGVGSGEALNEHILGGRWAPTDLRLEMLAEAIEIIRQLWTGEEVTHRGAHYVVENARLYTLPAVPPPIMVSAFGPKAVRLAARVGDGYVNTSPSAELVAAYRQAGGRGPISGGVKICWGPDADTCAKIAHRLWRTGGVPGELSQELRTPALFEQAASNVTVEDMQAAMACGPDVGPIIDAVRPYVDAGFDRVYITQIGREQAGFFSFYAKELQPALAAAFGSRTAARSAGQVEHPTGARQAEENRENDPPA
ncbi:MAG: class F420-dependent oxidoreductase [Ilumatobacteraceae bacterium]|nr:class F420-dependent oxidoreductase [Ilumatobacteraceae bacterium]